MTGSTCLGRPFRPPLCAAFVRSPTTAPRRDLLGRATGVQWRSRQPLTLKVLGTRARGNEVYIGNAALYGFAGGAGRGLGMGARMPGLEQKRSAQANTVLATGDCFFVYPTKLREYQSRYRGSFLHGGVTPEECILPVSLLTPRR